MDDDVSKGSSPGVHRIVLGSSTLGPALGAVLGSACLSIYLEGDDDPVCLKNDPWDPVSGYPDRDISDSLPQTGNIQ